MDDEIKGPKERLNVELINGKIIGLMEFNNHKKSPPKEIIPKKRVIDGFLSASDPPTQYPTLKAAKTTVMTEETLKMVLPK